MGSPGRLYLWLALLLAGVAIVVWACSTRSANADLRKQLTEVQEQLAAQQSGVAWLTSALSAEEASTSTLKEALQAASQQSTKLNQELSRLQSTLSTEKESGSRLASQLAQAQEEGRKLSQQIAELQARLAKPTPTPTAFATPTPTPVPAAGTPTFTPTPTPTPVPAADAVARARQAIVLVKSSAGEGSGFIFDQKGLVLTNAHVVGDDPSEWVTVITGDAVPMVGYVLGRHLPMDVAVIQLRTQDQMPALALGDSNLASAGNEVMFLGYPRGSPLGQGATITTGDLYAQRQITGMAYLQIDASLSPGNSGGPLINSRGEAIGIYTDRLFQPGTPRTQGVAFALAMNPVKGVIPSLSAGVAPSTLPPTPTPTQWTLYRNVAWGYFMRLPPGWTTDDGRLDDMLLWAPDQTAGGEVFGRLSTAYTEDTWTNFVLDAIRSRATTFREVSRSPRFLPSGIPGTSVLYIATFPGYEAPLKVRLITAIAGSRNLAVQVHAEESAWGERSPELETMASSFTPTP